jgi:hypothetical protein
LEKGQSASAHEAKKPGGIDRAYFFKAYQAAVNKLTDRDREVPEVRAFVGKARLGAGLELTRVKGYLQSYLLEKEEQVDLKVV